MLPRKNEYEKAIPPKFKYPRADKPQPESDDHVEKRIHSANQSKEDSFLS
jgi:hypothetical protein